MMKIVVESKRRKVMGEKIMGKDDGEMEKIMGI